MKKFILSSFILISFGFYTIWENNTNPIINPINQIASSDKKNSYDLAINSINSSRNALKKISAMDINNTPPTIKTTNRTTSTSDSMGMMGMGTKMMGMYRNGEYTGRVADAYYGYVQVKAIITNGKLSDIVILDYPKDAGTSRYINSYALPILKSEAISAQSTNINAVSGASESSPAFMKSLASALIKAKT